MVVDPTSRDMIFQRAGTMAEKAVLPNPVGWNSLADGVHSIPLWPVWVGWANPTGVRPFIRTHGIKSLHSPHSLTFGPLETQKSQILWLFLYHNSSDGLKGAAEIYAIPPGGAPTAKSCLQKGGIRTEYLRKERPGKWGT